MRKELNGCVHSRMFFCCFVFKSAALSVGVYPRGFSPAVARRRPAILSPHHFRRFPLTRRKNKRNVDTREGVRKEQSRGS